MSLDNLVSDLAQGPFWLFAMVVGVLVSFDVGVVELTRVYEPEIVNGKRRAWTSRMRWMTFWHATLHAGSFFLYTMVIYGLQFFAFELFSLPENMGFGILIFINFVIMCFVWWTYRSKIKEDHSDKSNDSNAVERTDMRLFVDILRAISQSLRLGDKARGIAVAGSVAVDMLAISALLKLYLLPNNKMPPVSDWSGIVPLDVAVFALIIFIVVAICVFLAHAVRRFFDGSVGMTSVFLRIAEPFAVFLIVAGTVRSMTQIYAGGYSQVLHAYGFLWDAIFSLFIVVSLFVSNGIGWNRIVEIYSKESVDAMSTNPPVTFSDIWIDIRKLFPAFSIIISALIVVLFAMAIAYSTNPGRDTHNHLAEATGFVATIVLIITIFILYWPSIKLDEYETSETSNFKSIAAETPFEFWSTLLGASLALLTLSLFNIALFGFSFEVESIGIWSLYILLTWGLFDLRRWRFWISATQSASGARTNDTSFAELISALGLASSAIALLVTFIVKQLIS